MRTFLCGSVICALGLAPDAPLASAQTAAPSALAANGRTAHVVEFGSGGAKGGEFRVSGPRAWTEVGVDGKVKFSFEETHRDDWSVYLFDRARSVYLQLDMYTRKVMYGNTPSGLFQIYTIVGASPAPVASAPSTEVKKVNGRLATVVEYGTGDKIEGRKLGEFRQTGPAAWANYDADGKLKARMKEVMRDEGSVYLRECSSKTDFQLDLHARKIISKESVFSNVRDALAQPVPVQAGFAIGAPPAPSTDCGYVIASVEPDDGLRFLRAPADTGSLRARAIVNRDPVRDPCTGELSTDSFWSLIPLYTMKVVPPGGQSPVDAFVMNIVSLRTGNTLQFDPDGYLKAVSSYFFKVAPPKFIFVPTGSVGGNTPLTFEIRELLADGTPGRKVLTFDDRTQEPATSMVVVNKPTEALLSGPDAEHYRRSFAVFSPNCPAVAGIFSRNANVSAERTQLIMSRWGIQGDMSSITPLAAAAYANWPPPFRDVYRVDGNATTPAKCPEGTVAVGLGLYGHSAEKRTLICRRYQGATRPSKTSTTKFPIADQGSGDPAGKPRQGEQFTPGAVTGLTCGEDRQCSMSYIEAFADTNQCRWMAGPRIDYWDGLARDVDKGERSLLRDQWFRPSNEVWCDGANEVLTGVNCFHAEKVAQLSGITPVLGLKREDFCDKLGLRCCKAPVYAGKLDSPHGDQNQTNVWSSIYGYDAKLDKNTPNLSFTCPEGYVGSGFDCGAGPTSCPNKSLGCKKLGVTDDGNRTQAPRTVDRTGSGVSERGLAVTGMKCQSPSCREIVLQHVKLRSDNTNHDTCRWATLTNGPLSSSPSECTASEYLADIRCKNGNDCSDVVEMKCCIDSTGRLPSNKLLEGPRAELASPPRVPPKPVNQKQVECRAQCDEGDVARSLSDCALGEVDRQCTGAAAVVVGCHVLCMIANP